MPPPEVVELAWTEPELARIETPGGSLRLTLSVGSGLARRPEDPPGRVWGLGDRGPNLKVPLAVDRFGLRTLEPLRGTEDAKILPLPEFGPTLAELQVTGDRVELVRTARISVGGRPITGRVPQVQGHTLEPVFDLEGRPLPPDAAGADTEGLVRRSDGGFWAAEEYGPSLMQLGSDGDICRRWTPEGVALEGCEAVLPKTAARRRTNRGFEGLALSPDDRWLYVGLQSGAKGADEGHTAIWRLDAETGALVAEYAYPFDSPDSFTADAAAGEVGWDDLKVCDLLACGMDELLVLERISKSARIYRISCGREGAVEKHLVFTTDGTEVAPDLEGMAWLSDRELLLVTDNDFGVEAQPTHFYRVSL